MLKAIKIRLYPDSEQVAFINKQLGCCRFVYNKCLEHRKESYQPHNISISSTECLHHIVDLKSEFSFLTEVHSKVLQQSVRDLIRAFDNFFKLHHGYPKFKSKKDNKQSCRFPKDAFIGIRSNRIDLIKALKDIHFKCSRKDEKYLNRNQDKVSSLTLTKDCSGNFYLSILIDKPHDFREHTNNAVGIDLGIKTFVVTSNAEIFDNLHIKKSQKNRLRRLHRQLSKKQKGSNNKEKSRIKLAKLYNKITKLTWKPSLRLLVLTANFGDGDDGASLSTIGLTFADYAYAMTEVAKYYGIPFVDLHSEQGINAITASYYTSDGIHWNQIGGQVAASLIISKLQNINNAI